MEKDYEYISGYCRAHNGHRLLECAFARHSDGSVTLEETDCDFPRCAYSNECVIIREARRENGTCQ